MDNLKDKYRIKEVKSDKDNFYTWFYPQVF